MRKPGVEDKSIVATTKALSLIFEWSNEHMGRGDQCLDWKYGYGVFPIHSQSLTGTLPIAAVLLSDQKRFLGSSKAVETRSNLNHWNDVPT